MKLLADETSSDGLFNLKINTSYSMHTFLKTMKQGWKAAIGVAP